MHIDLPKFLSKIENYSDTELCWIWYGTVDRAGYGRFYSCKKLYLAHRWLYQECFGMLSEFYVLDHLCGNKRCVNPQHLEPVTLAENIRRGSKGRKSISACKYGHVRIPENIYTSPSGVSCCKLCRRENMKRFYILHKNTGD